MRRLVTLVACVGGLAALAPTATAQVPTHQHFLTPPSGETQLVGPHVCVNPATETGFAGFHFNVHFGTANEFAFANNPITFTAPVPCP
jgi:hypothetical protein